MLKIYRTIRQRLLTEGKAGKYLRYAIGEIVLVVIGILIALSINNWNTEHKEANIEKKYLENIKRDLVNQIQSIELQLIKEKSFYEAASYLIGDYSKHKAFTIDSTFFITASKLTERRTFVITDPTYTDLISSGNISLLNDAKLKDDILNYYQELKRIERVIQNNNSLFVDEQYIPVFMKIGYYYSSAFVEYGVDSSVFEGQLILPSYETSMQKYSENILMTPENKLAFMNAISYRQNIAMGHYVNLGVIKLATLDLIQKLD